MGRNLVIWFAGALALACNGGRAAERAAPLAVRGDASPSFQITPLVQRFSARQGQKIKFAFDVQALEQPQSLRVRAVALKQQLNGLVVADEQTPPPDAVELFGPPLLDLKAKQSTTIHGQLDVPLSSAPFHAYGILVTDLGRPLQTGAKSDQTGIGVHFVTQYLLRVEVEVRGARQENAKELRIELASLTARDGNPLVEVEVANPTKAGVDFQLYCRLLHADGSQLIAPFGLAMPVRANRPEPQRYEAMIFSDGRVQLAAPVSEAIFPGEYQLELEWISRGRKCGKAISPATVSEGDFPAQASKFAQIAGGLRVTPSQIELSLARGGERRMPLRIDNQSQHPVQIRLSLLNLDGRAADWVLVQPSEFLLPAGRGRNVLLTAHPGAEVTYHRYGVLRVDTRIGESPAGMRDLPLALLPSAPHVPSFETGSARWDLDGASPAFVLPINNLGPVHLALNGRLSFSDLSGQKIDIPGGFDRWVLPGRHDEIRFPLHRQPAPGTYSVKIQIETGQGAPLTLDQKVDVK